MARLQEVGEEAEDTSSAEDDAVGGGSTSVGGGSSRGDGSVGAVAGGRTARRLDGHGGVSGGSRAGTGGAGNRSSRAGGRSRGSSRCGRGRSSWSFRSALKWNLGALHCYSPDEVVAAGALDEAGAGVEEAGGVMVMVTPALAQMPSRTEMTSAVNC